MKVRAVLLPLLACFVTLTGASAPVKIIKRWHTKDKSAAPPHKREGGSKHLLAKLQSLVESSRKTGLSPEEKAFIQEIQEMWKDDIMPAIYAAIEEGQAEIDDMFKAILECEREQDAGDGAIAELLTAIGDVLEELGECAVKESDYLDDKKKECTEVVEMKTQFITPPEHTPGESNEDRLQYLKDMNEYFCGTDKEFKDKMDDCKEAIANYTNTSEACTKLQNELESLLCELHSGETGVCMEYAKCRLEAIARYENVSKTVKEMEWETQDEYIAAVRIECMWDAWDLAETPCLVDEEYVEHCYNEPIDLTNLTINYPLIPDPHGCTMGLEGSVITHGPADHPCTEEYLDHHYASLDIDDVTLQKMKDECKECPPEPNTTTTTTELDSAVLVREGVKCPHFHGDRIFRFTDMTLETCYEACKSAPGCQHLAFAETGTYAGVCMGCIDGHWEEEEGFNGYDLPPKVAAANLHYLHHDAGDDKTCASDLFRIRGVTTPQCYEHCANTPGCEHFSFRSGTCAGCKEDTYTDASGFTVYDLTDLGLNPEAE